MTLSPALDIVGIGLVLATLPLLAELLALTAASLLPSPRAREQESAPEDFPLTVVVPAHNEEALIGRCIRSIASSAGPGVDLVAIAHNCSDATAKEAEAAGARVLVLNDPEQQGKGCALSYGFAAAMAGPSRAVLVIDADSVVSSGLIEAVRQRFLAGAQAVQCRYEVYNSEENNRTRLMALAFQGFNVIRPRGRERLGTLGGNPGLPGDAITLLLETVPLYLLYEASILLASLVERRERRRDEREPPDSAGQPPAGGAPAQERSQASVQQIIDHFDRELS